MPALQEDLAIQPYSTIRAEASRHLCMETTTCQQVWPQGQIGWRGGLKAKYNIEPQRINRNGGESEINILNRNVRLTKEGYEVEADPRHAELIIEQLIDEHTQGSRRRCVGDEKKEEEESEESSLAEAKKFRGVVARCLFLSLGRPESNLQLKKHARKWQRHGGRHSSACVELHGLFGMA